MMLRAVYQHGSSPDLEVDWGNPDDSTTNMDLTGFTVTLSCFKFGGATLFTKTTGFTIPPLNGDGTVPSPNLVVAWSGELDALADGTYVLEFVATNPSLPGVRMFGELVMRTNAPNFGYCERDDLLLGDMTVGPTINLYDYINGAADEMDASLGQRYTLPLNLTSAPQWVIVQLKDINAKLATGRFICAQAMAGGFDKQLHAYGQAMITAACQQLDMIRTGQTGLVGVPIDPASQRSRAPGIRNIDDRSPTDAFADYTNRHRNRIYPPVFQPATLDGDNDADDWVTPPDTDDDT